MTAFFYLIPFLLAAGQLARVDLGAGIRFYLLELYMGVFLLSCIVRYSARPLASLKKHPIFLMWVAWIVFGWLFTSPESALVDSLRALFYIVRVLSLVGCAVYIHRYYAAYLCQTWVWYVAIPTICVLQYLFFPDLRLLAHYGWDPHMYRAVGTIFDPPIVGGVLGIIWLRTMSLSLLPVIARSVYPAERRSNPMEKIRDIRHWILDINLKLKVGDWKLFCILVVTYAALILLYSRSTYLSLLMVTLLYLVIRQRYRLSVIFFLCTVAAIYLAPKTIPIYHTLESAKIGRMSTATSRLTEIRAGVRVWLTSPIYGIGYGRVAEYKSHFSSPSQIDGNHASSAFHSFWITQLATTGLVGVALLIVWLYQLCRARPELIYPILWISIIGVFDNVVFHPFVIITLIILYAGNSKRNNNSNFNNKQDAISMQN